MDQNVPKPEKVNMDEHYTSRRPLLEFKNVTVIKGEKGCA